MKAGYIFTTFSLKKKDGGVFPLSCLSFVIIDEEFGPIIFDTGSPYDNDKLIECLDRQFGLTPLDFKWVFNTHIHPDHVGGNWLFKNATIIFSREDFLVTEGIASVVFNNGDLLSYLHSNFSGYTTYFDEFEANQMRNNIKKYWSKERIGFSLNHKFIEDNPNIPPFIQIIPSFGHTLYHYSYVINYNNKKIFIAGDALSNRFCLNSDYETKIIDPHMQHNAYIDSIEHFKQAEGIIVPGHDRPFFTKNGKGIRRSPFNLSDIIDKM